MTKRVVHQKYLEAWLRGESVDFRVECGDFTKFCSISYDLNVFDNQDREFRITPKTVELTEDSVVVNITDFYADYSNTTGLEVSYERGYDELVTLIKKYLPRGDI